MANSIKGLTVKIGADTSDFTKELKKVDKEINSTQRLANELQKSLTLEYNDDRFIQAQKQLQSALSATEEKAKAIKEQLQLMEKSGNVDTAAYEKLETELAKAENGAFKLKTKLEEIEKIKIENTTKKFQEMSDGIDKAAKSTVALSAAAVGAIAGIVKLGSDSAAAGADLQDMADRLDVSAESLQRYDYIALQSGVETEQLVKSMSKARDAIGTGLSGTINTATKTLEILFGDLKTIPNGTEEGFNAIIEKLSEVEDSTMQAYYANEIFGEKLATDLIPLINNGSENIEKFNSEFEQIGYLSNEQVQSLADFDDELNIMKERMEIAKIELGIALLPLMENFVAILTDFVIPAIQKLSEWFSNLSEPTQKIITGILILTAALSPALFIISKIVGVIPVLIKSFTYLQGVTKLTAIGFAALGGAIGLAFNILGNWQQLSVIEKILYSLGLAALTAAAAMTVFHASWSLGLAIGAVTAAVVAGVAAISAAGKDIGYDDISTSGIDSSVSTQPTDYSVPTISTNGGGNSYVEDNSNYEINVSLNASGDLGYDAKTLANAVIEEIVLAKQARGS